MRSPVTPDIKDSRLAYGMAFDSLQPYYERRELYTCKKGSANCRNYYDYFMAMRLDVDPTVEDFKYQAEPFTFFNPRTDSIENSTFDFKVWTWDGMKRLILVIPQFHLYAAITQARIETAECRAQDVEGKMEIWTEVELFGPNIDYTLSYLRFHALKLWNTLPFEDSVYG